MLDIRCECLQLIVILLPICQLSVQVQSPSPGYCGGSKAVVRCGPGTTAMVTLALGPNTRSPETISRAGLRSLSLYFVYSQHPLPK